LDAPLEKDLTNQSFLYDNKSMKRGRPLKPARERLSRILQHRVTAREYRQITQAAKKAGLSVSAYARKKLFEGGAK
jgi:predicted HicB family RNase H-like nuclease